MSANIELNELIKTLSPDRQKLIEPFFNKDWFKNTDFEVQKELLSLPEDHDGFVEDLSNRPDEIGEVNIIKLLKLSRGNFLLIPVFEVRSDVNNQVFSYEYVSWKSGQYAGMRGVIFLETEGKITHFIVNRAHKFSTGGKVLDSVGGLFLKLNKNIPVNLPKKLEQEICYHLGTKTLKFKKILDLGKIYPDYGMSNNVSTLFAAIIDISNFPNPTNKEDFRNDHKPIGFELEIVHINEFINFVKNTEDNYFLGAAARILTHPDIDLEL